MSTPTLPPCRADRDCARVPVRDAALVYLGAWFIGQTFATAVVVGSGHTALDDAGPGWLFGVALAGWVPLLVALVLLGRRFGSGNLVRDYGLTFRPIDLLGVPAGVLTQVLLLRTLYWPLEKAWPGTFAKTRIEERARALSDHAHGAGLLLLILVVVVGAPLVEELVYRGLLQGAVTRRVREWLGMVLVAAWFAVVHFQPVETPGLFLVGLVLGGCALWTRRLGMGVVAHVAFNATGLVMVALT